MGDTQKLEDSLKQLGSSVAEISTKNIELTHSIEDAERKNEALKQENVHLAADLEARVQDVKRLSDRYKERSEEIRKSLTEAKETVRYSEELKGTAENAEQLALREKLDEYENKKALAARAVKQISGEYVGGEAPIDVLANVAVELHKELVAAKAGLQELDKENNRLLPLVENYSVSNLKLSEKNQALEEELATYSKALGLAAKRKKAAVG